VGKSPNFIAAIRADRSKQIGSSGLEISKKTFETIGDNNYQIVFGGQ
jgi:hypothetical protein